MADEGPYTTEAQYTQALSAAARIAEQSARLERAWFSGAGISAAPPVEGHAVPVDDLTNLDQILTAPGYQVLRSRPKVPTPDGTWFADEPLALNRPRTHRLIQSWTGALGALLLRDPNNRLYVVTDSIHMELIPTLLEPPHTEGDVLSAALHAYGLPAYEDGESGVTWLAVSQDPAIPERDVYQGAHFRVSCGEDADRVASAHDDAWGASFYDARGEYVDTLDACPPGSTIAEDSAHCARAVAERIAAQRGSNRQGERRHLWQVEHPHSCHLGNFYAPPSEGVHTEYDSWAEFHAAWGDGDRDLSVHVFRWDWERDSGEYLEEGEDPQPDLLKVYWVAQSSAILGSAQCVVTEADEPAVRAWLAERSQHVRALWEPHLDALTPEKA
ncbi:hypothetical protein AB0M58_13755 [Streptomyces bobili]|uniref:hypothetical protein n=1 Tax=Streptomyces bobili TaxID=67280 RepID=UPI003439227F